MPDSVDSPGAARTYERGNISRSFTQQPGLSKSCGSTTSQPKQVESNAHVTKYESALQICRVSEAQPAKGEQYPSSAQLSESDSPIQARRLSSCSSQTSRQKLSSTEGFGQGPVPSTLPLFRNPLSAPSLTQADLCSYGLSVCESVPQETAAEDISNSQETQFRGLSVSEDRGPLSEQAKKLLVDPVLFWIAFVAHKSAFIKDSCFVWHWDKFHIARFHNKDLESMDKHYLTCEGNSRNKSMSELLSAFCQRIQLPFPTYNELNPAAGALATALFQKFDGKRFNNDNLPFGVKGFMKTNRLKQIQLLEKKTGGKPVEVSGFGGRITLHKDEGMMERGLVNYSVLGADEENDFAFIIIANVQDKWYLKSFLSYPSEQYEMVIVTACFIVHNAISYTQDPTNHTEAAILARQIGQSIFEESTREYVPEETLITDESKGEGPKEEESAPVPRKTKKKLKKTKKGSSETAEETVQSDKVDVEEGTMPAVIIRAPTPKSENEVVVTAQPAAPTITTSSLTVLSSPSSAVRKTSSSASAFSFHSTDRRLACQVENCNIMSNASNPTAVICPRCTAYSFTRYCSLSHLLTDLRNHFISGVCGATLIPGPVVDNDTTSLPTFALPLRSYVQETRSAATGTFPKNILERHRQALYRSMSPEVDVDYFIFDDIDRVVLPDSVLRVMRPEMQKQYLQVVRGTGEVCAVVALAEEDARKARVSEVVNECLRFGWAAGTVRGEDCKWLFRVIKGELIGDGVWDARMEERVAVQMGFEFGWRLPVELREG